MINFAERDKKLWTWYCVTLALKLEWHEINVSILNQIKQLQAA